MKFSVRMFRQMALHVLYLERENGNVPYHLPEKRVVPIEKQMKQYIFSGTCNCGQMVQKFPGIPVKARKRNTSKGITFFPKTFHRYEPFHLISLRNYRKFHSNGKRSRYYSIASLSRFFDFARILYFQTFGLKGI